MLSSNTSGRAVRTAEHDRAADLAARHIERLGRRVDDVVDRLHGEVEGHELATGWILLSKNEYIRARGRDLHGLQAREGRADSDTSETHLSNGCVDNTLLTELVQEALGDL